jgi:hypothetical protein
MWNAWTAPPGARPSDDDPWSCEAHCARCGELAQDCHCDEDTTMKVHRIVLMVVDHDDIGGMEARDVLENNRYPNHCMSPVVMEVDTREIEWSDAHPLNSSHKQQAAFAELFDISREDTHDPDHRTR